LDRATRKLDFALCMFITDCRLHSSDITPSHADQ
jgi:hypothetical protein